MILDAHPLVRPFARVTVGVAMVVVWLSVFVDHGEDASTFATYALGAIGVGAIFCFAFGLFRGPNLTRSPHGSPSAIGSGVAFLSLAIVALGLNGLAVDSQLTTGRSAALILLAMMTTFGVFVALRAQQAAAVQGFFVRQGFPISHILIGRENGISSIFYARPIAAVLEMDGELVTLHRATLGEPIQFARVSSSDVSKVGTEGKHKMSMIIDVGSVAGGVLLRAIAVWDWEDFEASRDALGRSRERSEEELAVSPTAQR